MNCYGIEFSLRHTPALDPDYAPLYQFNHAFLKDARKPIGIAVERSGGQTAVLRPLSMAPPRWPGLTGTMWTGWSRPFCG